MKKYLILMLLLLSQCSGYSPIFSKNKINFYFDNININSNDLLSSSLKQQLNNYKYSEENQSQRQKVDIYFRLKKLIDEKEMGNLFKVMFIKNKGNKYKLGFN